MLGHFIHKPFWVQKRKAFLSVRLPTATSMGICVCVLHEELMELYNHMFPRQMVFNIFQCLVQVEGGSVARL